MSINNKSIKTISGLNVEQLFKRAVAYLTAIIVEWTGLKYARGYLKIFCKGPKTKRLNLLMSTLRA
jgi:hypothetical protein